AFAAGSCGQNNAENTAHPKADNQTSPFDDADRVPGTRLDPVVSHLSLNARPRPKSNGSGQVLEAARVFPDLETTKLLWSPVQLPGCPVYKSCPQGHISEKTSPESPQYSAQYWKSQ